MIKNPTTLATAASCAALTLCVADAGAGQHESRQLESHEHGVTELNVALDDNQLYVELDAPAMNFVGFEHPPRTAEQKQAVAETLAALQDAPAIFSVSADAACSVIETRAEHLLDDDDEGEHEEDDHSDADHDESGDSGTHSEFVASYRLRCSRPDRLQSLKVEMFDAFPLTTEVEARFIGPGSQTFGQLTSSEPELSLEP